MLMQSLLFMLQAERMEKKVEQAEAAAQQALIEKAKLEKEASTLAGVCGLMLECVAGCV
jgi:hypothetical protein